MSTPAGDPSVQVDSYTTTVSVDWVVVWMFLVGAVIWLTMAWLIAMDVKRRGEPWLRVFVLGIVFPYAACYLWGHARGANRVPNAREAAQGAQLPE